MREGKLRRLAKVEVALDERVGDARVGPREPGLLQEGQHGVGGELVRKRWQPWNHSLPEPQLQFFFNFCSSSLANNRNSTYSLYVVSTWSWLHCDSLTRRLL